MSDLVGTVAQVAKRLEVSEDTVQQLVRENRIPFVKLGPRKTVVPWRALEEWLDQEARSSLNADEEWRPLGLVGDRSSPS